MVIKKLLEFYNISLSVEKYPNDYSISRYLITEDAEGHKQRFSQSVQSFLGKTSVEHYNGVIDFTFNKECGITESGNKEGYDELIKLNTAKVYLDISTISYGDGRKWNYSYNYFRYELKEKL